MAGSDSGYAPGTTPPPAAPAKTKYDALPVDETTRHNYEAFAASGYAGAGDLYKAGHKANWVDFWSGGTPQLKGNPDQSFYNIQTGQNLDTLMSAYNDWSTRRGKQNAQVGAYRDMINGAPGRDSTILTPPIQYDTRLTPGAGILPSFNSVKSSSLLGG